MNYQRIYDAIIEKARLENRKKRNGTYYESHHIIPKCLGGSDEEYNRVLLTAKEHYVCHKLLIKIYPDNYHIELAFVMMALNISTTHQRINLSSRDFQYARELQVKANAEAKRGNKNRLGKKHKHPESAKKKISEYTKIHTPKFAFKKGQVPWNKGKHGIYSEETLLLMSNNRKGKGTQKRGPMSEEAKQKMRKPKSEEHKQKLRKPQKKVECPYCGKIGGINAMHQYHFNNCKFKK